MKKVRIAALQFAAGTDIQANLEKVLAMLDLAARHQPQLVVTPEFVNHASWYTSQEHCHAVAVDLAGYFVTQVAAKARHHGYHLVLNVTLRRGGLRCTASSILFNPAGETLAVVDKQVLMGHENFFLTKASQNSPVVETEIGRLGLYACMDGVICETPRSLALRGAQILCNSLNSFAIDEASLHVPVRAAENKVFVVAANKIGPLIPTEQMEAASTATGIPTHYLFGAGESQIVAPDGTVLAKGSFANEEVVVADIDPEQADHKLRPDGGSSMKSRRPELYRELGQAHEPFASAIPASPVRAACWQGAAVGHAAIAEFVAAIPVLAREHDLVALPELFFASELGHLDMGEALAMSNVALAQIEAALKGLSLLVVGSFLRPGPEKVQHCGMIVAADGIRLSQPQLHHQALLGEQVELGRDIRSLDTDFGRIAVVVGEDAIYPELFRILALRGADLVVISGHLQERWEIEAGLVERAAENRLCLVFATRPGVCGASLLADLEEDFTLLTPWKQRVFDGKINMPKIRLAPRHAGVTGACLNLVNGRNKLVSAQTHLLDSRPWNLWFEQ